MNDFQRLWWEQASSDHEVLMKLRRQGVAPCHQLHYLQMVTEKLSKAYFWRKGTPPPTRHTGFALFMKMLLQVKQSERQRIADIFAFGRFEDLQNWTRVALPLVYELEKLIPARSNDGPNLEYPWPHSSPENVPAKYKFDTWQELTTSGRGRQLVKMIGIAVKEFPAYA